MKLEKKTETVTTTTYTLVLTEYEAQVLKTLALQCTGVKAFSTQVRTNTTEESTPAEVLEALVDSLAGIQASYFWNPRTECCLPAFELGNCVMGLDRTKDK